jgi:arsenate reductase
LSERIYNVLFLCTGNSARSILAEGYLNSLGRTRFHAFSAGSMPLGRVNAYASDLLARNGIANEGFRSKSWDEFALPNAPQMDIIITVCDQAAGEVCPIWPGKPMTAHWGVPDPAAVEGDDAAKRNAFLNAYTVLIHRIGLLVNLKLETIGRLAAERQLRQISKEG